MRIVRTLGIAAVFVVGVAAGAKGQDAVKTLPDSYKLQFENDWVKIVRVHYEPLAKLPAHTHTELATAYVYLNDSGPVIFKHVGTDYGPATRPPTKAGAFRLYRGLEELHEVENTSPLPSDFLRVEFKTDPKEPRSLKGKFFRESYPMGENVEKIQFENVQIRISRLVVVPGRSLDLSASPAEPTLLIALSNARVETSRSHAPAQVALTPGQERWLGAGQREQLRNVGAEAAELLRFEFKTVPKVSAAP
jgi:hypothetical protein